MNLPPRSRSQANLQAFRINIASSPTNSTTERSYDDAAAKGSWRRRKLNLRCWLLMNSIMQSGRLLAAAAAAALLLCAAALVYWEHLRHQRHQASPYSYAVYIDGGSSGTRVHVFKYSKDPSSSYVQLVLPERTLTTEPGLSAYAGRPALAATSLDTLLAFAYDEVPEHLWHITPVRLLATAGLRLLSEDDAAAIIHECGALLSSSRFMFQGDWAKVLPGQAEGAFAWAAANYVTGALEEATQPPLHHHHHHQRQHSRRELEEFGPEFVGVLELGGASFQITFMPQVQASQQQQQHPGGAAAGASTVLPLPGVQNAIFTHSYLGLGMDSALHKAVDLVHATAAHQAPGGGSPVVWDPCLPTGLVAQDGRHGNASFKGCLAVAQQVAPQRVCQHPHSGARSASAGRAAGEHGAAERSMQAQQHAADPQGHQQLSDEGSSSAATCTVGGVPVPPLQRARFLAIENFFWTARALGLHSTATLAEWAAHGEEYCSIPWSSLHTQFAGYIPDTFLTRYCFGAAFIYTLLHHGFDVSQHERCFMFTNTIRSSKGADVSLNWVMGAALVDAMHAERHGNSSFMHRTGGRAQILAVAGPHHLMWLGALVSATILTIAALLRRSRSKSRAGKAVRFADEAPRMAPRPAFDILVQGTQAPGTTPAADYSRGSLSGNEGTEWLLQGQQQQGPQQGSVLSSVRYPHGTY